jgi:hypothetical protein
VRPFRLLAAVAVGALLTGPVPAGAAASPAAAPGTVIVTATVGSSATDVMPQKLWRRLVVDSLAARTTIFDEEPTIADEARCRAAHAGYAVLATFDRAPRLPGLAQDPDRVYAIARFTVRNCASGALLPPRVVALESDPSAQAARGETPSPASAWERPVRAALGHAILAAPRPPPHVVAVHGATVVLDRSDNFGVNQVLVGTPPAGASPPRAPYELVVTEIQSRQILATVVGKGQPRAGDTVEAAPAK